MVVRILDATPAADTNGQGEAVLARLLAALNRAEVITVSFEGVTNVTSSFVNAALVPLLETISFGEIKRRVRIIDSNRQINDMIKRRLEREALVDA
ncbi:STAS-like domain-containing protein [Methylobacterium sp. CM6257]